MVEIVGVTPEVFKSDVSKRLGRGWVEAMMLVPEGQKPGGVQKPQVHSRASGTI